MRGFVAFVLCNFSFCIYAEGQTNLVINGDFEIYDTCPYQPSQIKFAIPWFQPNDPSNPWAGSTDYDNSCSSNLSTSVPNNFIGYQLAHSGSGYAGAAIVHNLTGYNDSLGREYMEGTLSQNLISNHHYCVNIYSALANQSQLSSQLGIFFSTDSLIYYSPTGDTIHVIPQLVDTNVIVRKDTLNWVVSKWIYTALGGEKFLTIGNFWTYPNMIYYCLDSSCDVAYYYIDDVSVIELPVLDAGINDTICPGDSATLIGTISQTWIGMGFEWLPHNGLANPYSLITKAQPSAPTTYTLTVNCPSCNVVCLPDLIDTVKVITLPSLDAGMADTICLNDSATLNGTISQQWNGMSFEWLPHAGLQNPFSLNTNASPSSTTTYTLTMSCPSCSLPCASSLRDSMEVNIVTPPTIDAGVDDSICPGDSVALNGNISPQQIGMNFEWLPHTGITNPFSLNANASPSSNTTYTLTVNCSSCGIPCLPSVKDSVKISLKNCTLPNLFIPTILKGDELFLITGLQPNSKLEIFDDRGRLVYRNENYQNDFSVVNLAAGIYVVRFIKPDGEMVKQKLCVVR